MKIDTIIQEEKNGKIKTATYENGILREVEMNAFDKPLEGNVYLGKITHKIDLANDRFGFMVNIGSKIDAFLNADGTHDDNLTEGQSVVVQVNQEERDEKGAKLTRSVQIVGQNLVYCPYRMDVEVSAKIEDKNKAEEYRDLVWGNTTGQEGWILRTSSVDAAKEEVLAEMKDLREAFDKIRELARKETAPALLKSKANPLAEYVKRSKDSLQKLVVNARNTAEAFENMGFTVEIKAEPFKEYGVEDAIAEALESKINLPSGGRIYIEETKACVAMDVDSGDDKAGGSISRLNEEAAEQIVKQIILRNLAGKIVIDFAGSSEFRFIKPVLEVLEEKLKEDPLKSRLHGLSRGGLVEITRVRRRPSLRDVANG